MTVADRLELLHSLYDGFCFHRSATERPIIHSDEASVVSGREIYKGFVRAIDCLHELNNLGSGNDSFQISCGLCDVSACQCQCQLKFFCIAPNATKQISNAL